MTKLYILYISIIIEVIFYSRIETSKFALNVFGYSFGIFEAIYGVSFILLLFELSLPTPRKENLLNDFQKIAILLLLFLFLISFIAGIFNENRYFLGEIRSITLISVFILTLLNFNSNNKNIKRYTKNILLGFTFAGITVILSFVSSTFVDIYTSVVLVSNIPDVYLRSLTGGMGTYSLGITAITMFVFFIGMSHILFGHKSMGIYFMTLIGFVSTNIFFHKPIVIAFFLGNLTMFILYIWLHKTISSFIKITKYGILFILLIIIIVFIMPSTILDNFIYYINYGWLNIDRGDVEGDLSSGRFDLFYEFGYHALTGFGIAPWGIGYELDTVNVATPHNYLLYLSHQLGFFSMIIIVGLIISILYKSAITLKKCTNIRSDLAYSSHFGILVYLVTVMYEAQYSGILDKIIPYIFMFYSLLAILIHLNRQLQRKNLEAANKKLEMRYEKKNFSYSS